MAKFNEINDTSVRVRKQSLNHRSSVARMIDSITASIAQAKHNRSHAARMHDILKQLLKALNGVEYAFIREAEFYSDLKETLNKLYHHVVEATNRGKLSKYVMAKQDKLFLQQMQDQVDVLCGRIFLWFSYRSGQKKQ